MINFERIKAMSVEQMAEFIDKINNRLFGCSYYEASKKRLGDFMAQGRLFE